MSGWRYTHTQRTLSCVCLCVRVRVSQLWRYDFPTQLKSQLKFAFASPQTGNKLLLTFLDLSLSLSRWSRLSQRIEMREKLINARMCSKWFRFLWFDSGFSHFQRTIARFYNPRPNRWEQYKHSFDIFARLKKAHLFTSSSLPPLSSSSSRCSLSFDGFGFVFCLISSVFALFYLQCACLLRRQPCVCVAGRDFHVKHQIHRTAAVVSFSVFEILIDQLNRWLTILMRSRACTIRFQHTQLVELFRCYLLSHSPVRW